MSKIKLEIIFGDLLATPIGCADQELVKLFSLNGREALVLADRDSTGDVITASWPMSSKDDEKNLAILLFGARETGVIPSDTMEVILPDESIFTIDGHGV